MKRWPAAVLTGVVLLFLCATPGRAQDTPTPDDVTTKKRAQTGMKFLQIPGDPRAAGMGNTVTASTLGSSRALFANPATMGRTPNKFDASFTNASYIADITYNFGSALFRPANGQYGVIGLSVVAVDYGSIVRTIRADNEQGYVDLGQYSPTSLAVGLGYARSVTDRFTVGGQAKYVRQDMDDQILSVDENGSPTTDGFAKSVVAYDFGVVYDTGFRSLRFAMSTRNFAPEFSYVEQNVELPLTFRVGFEMNLMDLTRFDSEMHALLFSVEGRRPRDMAEQIRFGGEYTLFNTVSARAGYAVPADDEAQGLSLGGGLHTEISGIDFQADYAYTDMGTFGSVNRIGVTLGLTGF